jgi:threonine dehydrogenase-like Zn-dependent dehydrogenase
MRAVQVVAPGRIEFVEIPKPELRPGHALIRIDKVSLCGSDTWMVYYDRPDRYPFPPGTSGHEVVGVVEALGAPDADLQVGDRVLVLVDGHRGMAEYYLAPVEKVFRLPEDKPVEVMLQAQQLGTVIYACQWLPNLVGKDVAVIGQGSAGLWFDFMARRMGARRVIGIDLQAHRLAVSHLYGATDTIHNANVDAQEALHALTHGALADVVIEAAGEGATFNMAYHLVKREGDILCFGVPRTKTIEFDYETFFWKYPRVKTICEAQREPNQASTRLALDILARGELDPSPILTHRFSLDQVADAYELQRMRDEGAIKIVVDIAGSA